jgi:monovalent cation:proton antiporter-2 (CPA2) family protein
MLFDAFIYLAAAVLVVPIAKRTGLGSVLGYLIAGAIIGPYVLGFVGERGADVMHAAEFGVVMMLFLIGLELRPALLWSMRRSILGLGGAQVVVTTVALTGAALAVGLGIKPALVVGMILALSSTAIVLQSLEEKGLLKGEGGQATFAVLLFQDIAVIPMLALVPILGTADPSASDGATPGWLRALMILGAVAALIFVGRFLVRPMFRFLAATHLREVFTAAALLLVVGITLLMDLVGLSPALGTFVAGVVLAESEFRHELEADIEPFKGLLLGLFFISVGASIDFAFLGARLFAISGLVLGLIAAKIVVLYMLGGVFKLSRPARALFAFALGQGGEFAFVITSFAVQTRSLEGETANAINAIVALSMFLTPLVLISYERVIAPRLAKAAPKRDADQIEASEEDPVIIAGFGRFGQIVGRLLRAKNVPTTVLDLDADTVELVRRVGLKVHYGDATRLELLHAAKCERARLFILAIDDVDQSIELASELRKHYPRLKILARARNRPHYYRLRALGIDSIYRETFGSAMEMGVDALRAVGFRAHQAVRAGRVFRAHDEAALEKISTIWGKDQNMLFAEAKNAYQEIEKLMREGDGKEGHDPAWDDESLRSEVQRGEFR